MSVRLHFETAAFAPNYSRNNKDSGQKNLRCFPRCDARGHVERGFCGGLLTVRISGGLHPAGGRRPLRAWGEFRLAHSAPSVSIGQKLSLEAVVELRERSRSLPQAEWIRGELSSDGSELIFNRARLGWHYGWVSNVHTCDSEHVLRCYVFEVLEHGSIVCVAVEDSPTFRIYCSRRLSKRPLSPASYMGTASSGSPAEEGSDGESGLRTVIKRGSSRGEHDAGLESELSGKRLRAAIESVDHALPVDNVLSSAKTIVEILRKQRLPPPALDPREPAGVLYSHTASSWPSWNPLSCALGEVLSGVDDTSRPERATCCSESKLREIAPLLFNNAA
jgi:hypothetical protein